MFEAYDYEKEVREDIINYLDEDDYRNYTSAEDAFAAIYDDFMNSDSVTGKASGSYWFSSWKAEEALAHNWDLLVEAADEFGSDLVDLVRRGPETCDVVIRCYLLPNILMDVLSHMWRFYEEEGE